MSANRRVSGRSSGCLIRVTHASVGATDVIARRGDYLLKPFAGAVYGYDFVGVLKRVDRAGRDLSFAPGQRVAGILPAMGAHATQLVVPASLLVAVPGALPLEVAATLPLDGVTARHALALARPRAKRLFVQGVSGAVGTLAAQLARREGLDVIGTASAASAEVAERLGAVVIDYRDQAWPQRAIERFGQVDGAIDHTGSAAIVGVVARSGRIVRTAFGGEPGRAKVSTLIGSMRTAVHRYARPAEVICSVPMYVATRRGAYRRDLAAIFDLAAKGELTPLEPVLHPFDDLPGAFDAAAHVAPGHKVVVEVGPT
jgi:NADPH:quinone reductase-like Zn-dependent oxidoreductase